MESIIENLRRGVDQLLTLEWQWGEWKPIFMMIVGTILLLFGRKLYWFILIAVGFVGGSILAQEFFPPEPQWLGIAAAFFIGIAAAILIVFLQKLALRLAGMIAGGFLGYTAAEEFFAKPLPLLALFLGALLGFWLVMILFDWALIVLSSLSGTALITECIPLEKGAQWILAAGLLIVGIAIQWSMQRKSIPSTNKSQEA